MTLVKCGLTYCKYNEDETCTNKEISLRTDPALDSSHLICSDYSESKKESPKPKKGKKHPLF